jgi:hypothetical protein
MSTQTMSKLVALGLALTTISCGIEQKNQTKRQFRTDSVNKTNSNLSAIPKTHDELVAQGYQRDQSALQLVGKVVSVIGEDSYELQILRQINADGSIISFENALVNYVNPGDALEVGTTIALNQPTIYDEGGLSLQGVGGRQIVRGNSVVYVQSPGSGESKLCAGQPACESNYLPASETKSVAFVSSSSQNGGIYMDANGNIQLPGGSYLTPPFNQGFASHIATLVSQRDQCFGEKAKLSDELRSSREDRESLGSQIYQAKDKIAGLEDKIKQLEQDRTELLSKIDEAKTQRERDIANLTEELEKSRKYAGEMNSNWAIASRELKICRADKEVLQNEKQNLQDSIKQIESLYDTCKNTQKTLQETINLLRDQLTITSNSLTQARNELAICESKLLPINPNPSQVPDIIERIK